MMMVRKDGVVWQVWAISVALGCLVGGPCLVGCGGAASQGKTPTAASGESSSSVGNGTDASKKAEGASAKAEASEPEEVVPTKCAQSNPCRPPSKWVERLCQDIHPGLGLYLFQSGQPWEKLYLRGRTSAINASGGATMEGWLEFDEEVLVLRMRKADPNGIQVSGATESYDALRWDGSCVTLSGGEVTTKVPPSPKSSFVTWRALDPNIQEALKEDELVREGYRARQKECKGATMGEVTAACEKADKRLSVLIVQQLRAGAKVPLPTKLP
jgi:hypothetical protein